MKAKFTMVVFLLVIVVMMAIFIYNNPKRVSFETIEKNTLGSMEEQKKFVIRDETDFEIMWNQTHNHPNSEINSMIRQSRPEVDFSKNTIVAVFNGRATVGTNIEIKDVMKLRNRVIVFVKRTYDPKGKYLPSFAMPYHIIKIPKTDKKVFFIGY